MLFVLLLVSGCATLDDAQLTVLKQNLPPAAELAQVGFFPQEAYHCGPAALATVLTYTGIGATPEQLAPQVYLPGRQGSLQAELLGATRRHGRIPYVLTPRLDELLREVAAGRPVVVLQNLALSWYPKWHYAVVVGYDLPREEIVLRSGVVARHVIPLATFVRTWRRADSWAVVALTPGELPATAVAPPYLESVIAFERLGDHAAAARAFRAATTRWPDSLGAWLGWGNSLYAHGDKPAAAAAFRAALEPHPVAVVYNNLAQTLLDLNELAEAERMARRAVELGGTWRAESERTLAAIRLRLSMPEAM